jgi:hypothetical protein
MGNKQGQEVWSHRKKCGGAAGVPHLLVEVNVLLQMFLEKEFLMAIMFLLMLFAHGFALMESTHLWCQTIVDDQT